ncbi:MAG: M48 family metallopeptidase [Sedimentisphaerales bacterium]|nr:M48 family metallopeptidase [Sedimentisphaerales bacterium]
MFTNNIVISDLGSVAFTQSPRAKYQRITIRPDKTITVTISRKGSLNEAKRFLRSKTAWVQRQLQKIDQHTKPQDTPDLNIDFEKAQKDLFHRLEHFSEKYSMPYKRAAFRCQKTRWGSCSGKNSINLNVNIAFLPENLQDYIILHELVHTKVKNHSKQFWTELNKYTDGMARELSKKLKKYNMKVLV